MRGRSEQDDRVKEKRVMFDMMKLMSVECSKFENIDNGYKKMFRYVSVCE